MSPRKWNTFTFRLLNLLCMGLLLSTAPFAARSSYAAAPLPGPLPAQSVFPASRPIAQAELVGDINPTNASSDARYLTEAGGSLYLTTRIGNSRGYWVTSGTPGKTLLLAAPELNDINCCADMPDPHFTWFDGKVFFVAKELAEGVELWQSDGTPLGTRRFFDLVPGGSAWPDHLTVVGDWMYFTTTAEQTTGPTAFHLMRTDGFIVQPVIDFSADPANLQLAVLDGRLLFNAYAGAGGSETLWISEGAPWNTHPLNNPAGPAFDGVRALTPGQGPNALKWMYFSARDAQHGQELWRTVGTPAGTRLVKDVWPGSGGYFPGEMVWTGSSLYFAIGDGAHNEALWRTDGTEGGTALVSAIPSTVTTQQPAIDELTVFGDVYFAATTEAGRELWRTDGTPQGTVMAFDAIPGPGSGQPYDLTVASTGAGRRLFFATRGDLQGFARDYTPHLWAVEENGEVIDLAQFGGCYSYNPQDPLLDPHDLLGWNNSLYFTACDNIHQRELWVSDGTPPGTRLAVDFNREGAGSNITFPALLDGRLFFTADDESHGPGGHYYTVWQAGSEPGSAAPLLSRTGSQIYSTFEPLYAGKEGVLFSGNAADGSDYGLFRFDGAQAAAQLILQGYDKISRPNIFVPYQDSVLIFDAHVDWDTGREYPVIWKTDGTEGGTNMVAALPDGAKVMGYEAYVWHDFVYFAVYLDGQLESELWRTDGTALGTQRVAHVVGQFGWVQPITPTPDLLYFYLGQADETGGTVLWQSDGTTAGTRPVMKVGSKWGDIDYYFETQMAALGDTLLFMSNPDSSSYSLMKTGAHTTEVETVYTFGRLEYPQDSKSFVTLDGAVYFCSGKGRQGVHLWRSDGTPQGTYPVTASLGSYQGCSNLQALDGQLYFAAASSASGEELWGTTGPNHALYQLVDVNPGAGGSAPIPLASDGEHLWFTAFSPETGQELWAVNLTRFNAYRAYLPSVEK